ncbi:MAG TPA: peptidoglycan DD-metalloendopeptidase family protein [Allosphingosinicella sp.]
MGLTGLYHGIDFAAGPGGGGNILTLKVAAPRAPLVRPQPRTVPTLRARLAGFNLVTDLGVGIGSREWLRGAATCVALCAATLFFSPGLEPLIGASPAPVSEDAWHEVEALTIAPLALGAGTGRRMAPTDAVVPILDAPERPSIELTAMVGEGDSFARVLQRAGVAAAEAGRVTQLVGDVADPNAIAAGTVLDVTLGSRSSQTAPRPLEALAFRARLDLKLNVRRVDGRLVLTETPVAVDGTPLRIQGRVGTSLYRAARAAGVPAQAVQSYIRAIASQIDIGELDADDRFDIVLEHRRAATGESEAGALLYAGLERADAKNLQLMPWMQDGRVQWFEASGVGKARGVLQRPVPGLVSSDFGLRRHPILGYTRMHKGMDFRAGYGTPILAATDGIVAAAGWAGGYGQQVRLSHAGGVTTSYSHMSRIVAAPGSRVRQGQLIGYVGSSGLSTGPHLHYELHVNGVPVDPASVQFATRAQLSGSELSAFRARLRALLAVRPGTPESASERAI